MDEPELTQSKEADAIASTLAAFCKGSDDQDGLEVLIHSVASLVAEPRFDGMGDPGVDSLIGWSCTLTLMLERGTFEKFFPKRKEITERLKSLCDEYIRPSGLNARVEYLELVPKLVYEDEWRMTATLFLATVGLTNQGRAHSGNVAPLDFEGLKFRSEPEKHFYRALKRIGIPFSPLPVFVQGGDAYERREPDFVLLYKGRLCIVEIHGPLSNQSDERLSFLTRCGALLARVAAVDCGTRDHASDTAQVVLDTFDRQIGNRGLL
jgi:hypothetical protein